MPRHLSLGPSSNSGYSLPEVVVAASLLAVALLGIAGLVPAAYRMTLRGGKTSQATAVAQGMMEILRGVPFDHLPRYHALDTRLPATFPREEEAGFSPFPAGTIARRWANDIAFAGHPSGLQDGWGTVSVEPMEGDPLFLVVRVRVGWSEMGGARSVHLVTLRSRF